MLFEQPKPAIARLCESRRRGPKAPHESKTKKAVVKPVDPAGRRLIAGSSVSERTRAVMTGPRGWVEPDGSRSVVSVDKALA